MDTRLYLRHCLLGMTFLVILHQCETASAPGTWRICPQGHLYHKLNMKLGRPYATCCYPTRCGVGEEIKPCTINGTHDTCQACGTHYNQSQRTSSFTMNKRCVSWPLDENCEDERGIKHFLDWRTRRCLCDLERGQKFLKPESWRGAPKSAYCQLMQKCEPGYEPNVDGKCVPCEHGYFKATKGYSLCEPQTECHELGLELLSLGGSTADNNCSEPVVFTTTKPTVTVLEVGPGGDSSGSGGGGVVGGQNPRPPTNTLDKTVRSTTTAPIRSGSSRSFKETGDQEGGSLLWPIILAVIFLLVLIIIIVIILFYRKRKGMSLCSCARFKSTDVEKTPGVGTGHGQHKNGVGNGILMEPHPTVVTKGVNNNINGSLPQHLHQNVNSHRYPHSQHNGNTVHFSESSDLDSQVFQNQKNSSHQMRMSPAPRAGILRNGSDHHSQQLTYGHYGHSRSQEASIDSIGREKLHVNGFEANQELGENDPLLIAEGPTRSGAGHDLLHNTAFASSNSPPINMSPLSPGIYTSSGVAVGHPNIQNAPLISHSVGNMNPNYNMVNSSPTSPAVPNQTSQQPTHQVTFAPTADTVTFKRSISVIASPEGEVEEEELEANVPRFSQILPDGPEDPSSSVNEPNPILRMLQEKKRGEIPILPMDSPQREMTHQMRLPSERLQHRPHQNLVSTTQQQQQRNPKYPQQGFPPALFRASSQPTPDSNIPDHCIMDLKEQQLANSFHSSLEEGPNAGLRSDSSNTGVLKLEDFTASLEQTNLKVCPGSANNNNGAISNNSNGSKQPDFGKFVIGSAGSAQNTLERKRSGNNSLQRRRFLSGSGRQNSIERKRRSSGSDSAQNTLEFKRGGDKQRSCLKNFSGVEDGETEEKKLRLGRTVSFDAEEEKSCDDSIGHDTKPKQVGNSLSSSSSDGSQGPYLDTSVDLRKEPRTAEEGYEGENESDGEDTDPKLQRQSDELDLSSSEDGQASPVANTYRRCQSESASSSTEAIQKPPPRSLSEEKPLKMERPIAKVKPMLASDNSVNKLVTDEDRAAVAATTSSGAANILDYSSESSSGEENLSSDSPRQDENDSEDED